MKKLFTLLFLGFGSFAASAQTIFSQNFSGSTTLTDYFTTVNGGAGTNGTITGNKFTSIATGGTTTNTIANGRLQLTKTTTADGSAIQLNNISSTGDECIAVSFDFSLLNVGSSTSGRVFQLFLGNGTSASGTGTAPTASLFANTGLFLATATTFGFDYTGNSGAFYSGGSARTLSTNYRVTYVVNASSNPVNYVSSTNTAYTVPAKSYDVLIDGTRGAAGVASLTTGVNTFTDLRLRYFSSNYIPESSISFDNFSITKLVNGGTLPVSFLNPSAKLSGSDVQVNWSTASEHNNDHFEIEASTDGKTFKTIKTVATKNGNSSTTQAYQETISLTDIAGLLAIPALLGFVGFAPMSRRRKFATLALVGFAAAASFVACQKEGNSLTGLQEQNKSAIVSGQKSVYIRIKQVDKNGDFTYSEVVVAK